LATLVLYLPVAFLTNDRTRWSHIVDFFIFENIFDGDLGGAILYRPDYEYFVNLSTNTFLSIGGGLNSGLSFGDGSSSFLLGGEIMPKLVHFFNNSFLELGLQVETPVTDFEETSDEWIGRLIIGGEYFIQNNLSIRAEIKSKLFGEIAISDFFGSTNQHDVNFNFGINYFLNRSSTE